MLLGLEENMLFIRRKHPIHSTLVLLPAFALNRRSLFTHGGDGVEPQTISASCSYRPLAHVLKCDVTQVGGIDPLWLRSLLLLLVLLLSQILSSHKIFPLRGFFECSAAAAAAVGTQPPKS